MRFTKMFAAALLASVVSAAPAFAGALDELSADQQNQVRNGETVTILEEVNGSVWPKIRVYKRIEATPEEVAALAWDTEDQPNYAPDIKEAHVVNRPGRSVVDTEFVAKLPFPLNKERYTVQSTLTAKNQGYQVAWTMVRSDNARSIDGSSRVEALGNASLLAYTNLVVPANSAASLVKKQAIDRTVTAVQAIAKRVEELRVHDRAKLDHQIETLRLALSQ